MATPIRVLIVENSENDALLVVDHLERAGYEVEWQRVDHPDQLRAEVQRFDRWDLILADYSMPGFGGIEALEIYKSSGLDVPFILVSGSIGEEKAVEAMRTGAHDYIMKDRIGRLCPAVDRELREASNRRERSLTVHENQRLNSQLLELNEALRLKIDLVSRSRADLEQVTWAASHDLKEPLRLVTTYSQLLIRRRLSKDSKSAASIEDQMQFGRYIGQGVERAMALLDGLLAYARNLQTPADMSIQTDAGAVAREAIDNLASRLEACGAAVTVADLPAVRIRPEALHDVLSELILNAAEYSREDEPCRVHLSSSRHGGEIRFAVQDNGIGIKPEHQARIFQLFRRLHGEERPGIGVGLPLCKCLIENYGGQLWVESEPGVGSTFYFTLTAADALAGAAAT